MEGEELRVLERLIVAPAVGVFEPVDAQDDVNEGDAVGHVVVSGERIAVRSRFTGALIGMLAVNGERVREGQPVAWLRTA
jgi:multidrug efflux pump subunit AcrA (membrane-fusion protein)